MWGIEQFTFKQHFPKQISNFSLQPYEINIETISLIALVIVFTHIVLQKILANVFGITSKRVQHKIDSLEFSYFYHLSIVIIILSDVNWNGFDLCLWVFSYVCIGMIRKNIHIVKIEKQIMLNDCSYNNKIVALLSNSKRYGFWLFVGSIAYFILVHFSFTGISIKMTNLLLFPTLMLAVDSLFLWLSSLATNRDILCYYNQNINEIPPTYKLELIYTIVASSIRAWHYYNLFRLFFKSFIQKIEFLDSMWILSVLNAGYISVSTLVKTLKKYRTYNKLIQKMNKIFKKTKSTPDQICIICMQQLLNCRKLTECGHLFHYKCLFEWVQNKYECPICRVSINLNFQ